MATIYEVAKLAGVSPATVSRVFNGVGVSPAKTQAVRDAADELRYTPSRAARSLRMQTAEVIALIIPDIENPYFTELARGVEDIAQQAGYSVVLCNSDTEPEKEATYLEIAISSNMAGIIVAPASKHTDLSPTLAVGRPVVAVDRGTSEAIDRVVMANFEAGRAATDALLAAGYRRVACLTGPRTIETAHERALGWRAAMSDHEAGQSEAELDSLLLYSSFRVEGGRDGMLALLDLPEPPDAVVAGNNLLGVGALQVLTEHGLTPPAVGVAVVGSLPFTTLSPQAVTIVRLPAREMGVQAAQMLLDRIAGDAEPARTVILPGTVRAAALGRA